MDRFKEISAFVLAAQKGSLSAAAQSEAVTPAVISRRLDSLEARLGVKLLVRTTRRISLTFEGVAFFEDSQRLLNDLANAEATVSLGGVKASGHIRLSAPAGFGRRHVAPLVRDFVQEHGDVSVNLDLTDRIVDIVNEGYDCAVRVGALADSSLVSVQLAWMRRVVVASPLYLQRRGRPRTPADLRHHDCLGLSQQRGWMFRSDSGGRAGELVKIDGRLQSNDGAVLREWALDGLGLAWRSTWEVGDDLQNGALESVLDDFAAPAVGVYAMFPQRRMLPLRVRLLIDFAKHRFSSAAWNEPAIG